MTLQVNTLGPAVILHICPKLCMAWIKCHRHFAVHAKNMAQHIMEHTGSFGLKHSQR